MASKKKTSKKKTSKKKSGKKPAPSPKRKAAKSRPAGKRLAKKAVSKKAAGRKTAKASRAAAVNKKTAGKKIAPKAARKKQPRNQGQPPTSWVSPRETSGLQSGDLQGLSNSENVDSESVDELLEEGNAFEAGVVSGVEESRDRDGKEVRTRELPEDDVPEEYLDEQ